MPRLQQPNRVLAPKTNRSDKYALLSVSDKSGITDFARSLDALGFRIISTGGTAKALIDEGLNVVPIQDITGNPESFDGRMKTISFQVESGILYDRTNPSHVQQAEKLGVKKIDIVVANLYPFEQTVQNSNVTLDQAVESIDVGGPTMVRAAAKNFKNVLVIVDPNDYGSVTGALEAGSVDDKLRQDLAAKAFDHLSFYDAQIARHLRSEQFPAEIALPGRRSIDLRYGENPHQKGVVYFEPNTNSPLRNLQKLTGRELSYVNFTDIAAGLESVRVFKEPTAVVIKHNSPSGIAFGNSSAESLMRAVAADPESAFGGVIVLNQPLDIETAQTFASFKEEDGVLIDIVAAPNITDEAKDFIRQVRKSTGIYMFGEIPQQRSNSRHLRFFDGGFVMQDWDDNTEANFQNWKVAGGIDPTPEQLEQMRTAWKFIGRIRSNSIIIVDKDIPMTRGIGSGQTSRVRATKIALEQAGEHAKGAVLASDSFFPFDDSVKLASEYGISAIIQQGGSINDKASIEAANVAGIPMVFTGERKFWH
ncbi:MAG: bifunctional phosphoribosylaminoimidazolecarboxamide formyltransferase/IMP cyclohydrolase [Patescibacteria group bacterium]